jgi:hypothetical protein
MSKIANSFSLNMHSFMLNSLITFSIVVFVTFINGTVTLEIGNFVWLPIGAVSLCYLLFGFEVCIAVFLGISLSSYLFHNGTFSGLALLHFVGTFSPLLAIAAMKFFKLSTFFDESKIVFQHLLFLGLLTALFNTLMKFFVFSYSSIEIDALKFIQSYLIGDILGCLVVLFFAALVIVPGIRKFAPNLVPLDK